jgi:hypothetical protein
MRESKSSRKFSSRFTALLDDTERDEFSCRITGGWVDDAESIFGGDGRKQKGDRENRQDLAVIPTTIIVHFELQRCAVGLLSSVVL